MVVNALEVIHKARNRRCGTSRDEKLPRVAVQWPVPNSSPLPSSYMARILPLLPDTRLFVAEFYSLVSKSLIHVLETMWTWFKSCFTSVDLVILCSSFVFVLLIALIVSLPTFYMCNLLSNVKEKCISKICFNMYCIFNKSYNYSVAQFIQIFLICFTLWFCTVLI